MNKKTPIRSAAGLSNKAVKKPRSKKDPLKDLSKQNIRDLLDKLTRENKELRKARKEVEASRQRYTDLYDSAPVGCFTFDRNGVVLEVNLTGAALLGVEKTKLVKTPLTLFISKEGRDTFNTHRQKVFRTGKRQTCELELTRKDGKAFSAKLESVRADGETFRTTINDITKRKKAEETLKKSEEKYRGIFDRANDGIIAYDLNAGKFLYVNKSMSELTGHSGEEILKLGVKDLHPEKDFPFVLKEFEAMASGEKTVTKDIPVLKKDGSVIYCDIGSSFIGQTTLLGFFRDVTDRKLAEDRINHFASFPQLNPNPVMEVDAAGKVTFCNPATQKILDNLGLDKGDTAVFLPADLDLTKKELREKEEASFYREVAVKDRIFGETVYFSSGAKVARIYAYEITERKQAEKVLQRAHDELESRVKERTAELFEKSRELESFFKHTQTCLVFLDKDFNFIRVNEAYAKACSRQVTDFEGHNHFVDYPSEELRAKFQQVVETKEPYSDFKQPFTFPEHPEWGTTYWDFTVSPVLDAEGDVDFLVLSMLDVTDRVQAEAQIFHLNRLYGMLSKVNTSILRMREPDELYRQLCRIAVEEGRFRMAWVGLLDPTTKKVVPAYSYGDTGGYLDTIIIYAADVPEGMGPTGRAIREGKNMICSDVGYDPIMLPWKDRALKQGFRSVASIPLRLGGSVIGAFTIYAGAPQFFTDEELALLTSLADNISFAINAMSNEKMRLEAEMTLRKSAEEIQDLYNNAPCGYHLIDKDGTIVRINDTELKWLGCSRQEVVGKKKIYEFYTPESVETFKTRYPEFVEHGSVGEVEVDILRRDGSVLSMFIKSTAIRDKNGNFLMCRSTLFDITDRKEAEQRIRANHELLKLFAQKYSLGEYLDSVCDLVRKWSGCRHAGFRIIDEKGEIPFKASIDYAPDFLKREDDLSLVHDQCICTRIIAGSPESSDLACMTPGGSFISGNTSSFTEMLPGEQRSKYRGACMQAGFKSLAVVPLRHRGQALGAIHLADEREGIITLKKMEFIEQLGVIVGEAIYRFSAEEELRKSREEMRNLSKYLREAREMERTAVAREIHDELGQIITALRLNLAWIRDHYKEDPVIFDKSKSMLALVDTTIQTIQNIITELRPGILDVLGLFAAIEWQAAELKKMSGITCDLSLPSEDVLVVAEISTNIFRIIQELFTNVVRYSQASNVSVRIEILRDRLFLNVTDNGIGIRPQDISSPVSFGIIGIRERVYAMKGEMDITGTSGMGTSINIAVPVNAGQSAQPE